MQYTAALGQDICAVVFVCLKPTVLQHGQVRQACTYCELGN